MFCYLTYVLCLSVETLTWLPYLLQYLCDRADPPVPCELVRGHLDYTPHAWNVVPVRQGNILVRMIVDACYPTNIKEETDPEYFCR